MPLWAKLHFYITLTTIFTTTMMCVNALTGQISFLPRKETMRMPRIIVSMPSRAKLHSYEREKINIQDVMLLCQCPHGPNFISTAPSSAAMDRRKLCVNALTGQTSFLHRKNEKSNGKCYCVNALTGQTSFLQEENKMLTMQDCCVNALTGQTSFLQS